jgi:Fur family ferric uptake transcriptional regulator
MADLRRRGIRLTPQREMVLDAIRREDEHLTADEIYRRVQKRSPAINVATVYRTLELLAKLRIIHEINLGDCARYELCASEPHHHLVCQVCGQTISAAHAVFQPLERKLKQQFGFSANIDHLVIYGQCAQCQTKDE